MLTPESGIFTVSRLNQLVRQLLEQEIGIIWLSAEISNLSQPASGHWYFTLKDNTAQVRCAMFRMANRLVSFRPQNGQQVLVKASLTLYEPRGDYQLVIETMQPAGEGLLQQQFEQLKKILAAQGLFDSASKKALPTPANCVGVITSASGAALRDILHILNRRDPGLPVIIYPTAVQGKEATGQIVRAIELANQRNECDVLIVGRGGGSLEDLWCFNEESVARAIFNSRIPIVSAVGHETDVTIADFVADLRAPTPSAAAELVSRNSQELLDQLHSRRQHLEIAMDYYFARQQQIYSTLLHRLQQQHPALRLSRQQTILVKFQQKIQDAFKKQLTLWQKQQQLLQQKLLQRHPMLGIQQQQNEITQINQRLNYAMTNQLNTLKQRMTIVCSRLDTVSPLATLARGYSVTTTEDGQLIRNSEQVSVGDIISSRLAEGIIESQVVKTSK